MIDKYYIELINSEIDGLNSPEDSLILRNYLDLNPEVEKYYSDLCLTVDMLEAEDKLEVPRQVKDKIFEKLFGSRNLEKLSVQNKFISAFRKRFQFSWNRSFSYGLTLGLAVGIICMLFLIDGIGKNKLLDVKDYYGTIGVNNSGKVIGHANFTLGDAYVSGRINSTSYENLTLAKLSLSSKHSIIIIFQFDESTIFKGVTSPGPGNLNLNISETEVQIVCPGGINSTLTFTHDPGSDSPLLIKVLYAGNTLFENKNIRKVAK